MADHQNSEILEVRESVHDQQKDPVQQIFHTQPVADNLLVRQESKEQPEKLRCTCSRGRCTQKYCVCLKSGTKCDLAICSCKGCENDDRLEAVGRRNEQKKFLQEEHPRKGCNCRKNYCKKNYCICHGAGQYCDPNLCNCVCCYNYENAPDLPIDQLNEKHKSVKKKFKLVSVENEQV